MEALISLTLFGIALIYTEVFKSAKRIQTPLALLGIIVTAYLTFMHWHQPATYFNFLCVVNDYAIAFNGAMLLGLFLIIAVGSYYYKDVKEHVGELYGLMFFSVFGGYLITGYSNLIMLYLGIETLSIPLYVLAGSKKFSFRSNEASFKYFVLGGFASAVLLLGIALVYGATGSFRLDIIGLYANYDTHIASIFKLGMILMLIGFLFKVAAMPFHFWAPDVYDGSPTLVTAFMATVTKTAVIAAFFALFDGALRMTFPFWGNMVWAVTLITLVASNVIALNQTSTKRLMAYASISSSGFILLAILTGNALTPATILYYMVTYTLAAVVAFTAIIAVRKAANGDDSYEAFNGLGKRNPLLAFSLTVALLSLAGIPITGGFFAKYYLFMGSIWAGYIWLTIVAVIAALVGIYYFLRLISHIYRQGGEAEAIELNLCTKVVLVAATILTLVLGVYPNLIISLI